MRREIFPGLFQEGSRSETFHELVPSGMNSPVAGMELQSLNPLSESRRLEKKIEALVGETRAKQEEVQKGMIQRYEHFLGKLNNLESRFDALAADLRQKYSHLSSKTTEGNLSNLKTQALVDKHTHVLRQFESRTTQLTRVIEEQEFQLMNYKSALDEARKEIAKLKKL